MISEDVKFAANCVLLAVVVMQLGANATVLAAFLRDSHLRRSTELLLLVALAFIDFLFAILVIPLIWVILFDWESRQDMMTQSETLSMLIVGGPSAALMKSGCTVTTFVAIDRIAAIFFPVLYIGLNRRRYFLLGIAISFLMAAVDLVLVFVLSCLGKHPSMPGRSFNSAISPTFRSYWGMSNMVVNLLSCLLTIVVVLGYRRWKRSVAGALPQGERNKNSESSINKVSLYILVVSAVFGVIPGCLNGISDLTNFQLLSDIHFFIGVCASLSGFLHAFIFGMAHRGIRARIHQMIMPGIAKLITVAVIDPTPALARVRNFSVVK